MNGIKQPETTVLDRKQELQGNPHRTPHEEGELRGLFVHPDDPRARELLMKEYLSSKGLGEMSDDEREELRQIRAAIYASQKRVSDVLGGLPERPNSGPLDSPNQNRSLDEWNHLCQLSKLESLQNGWANMNPKDVLDKMISGVHPPIPLPEADARKMKVHPSGFELFLISKLQSFSPHWSQGNKNPGSLGVLESMICMRDTVRTQKFLQAIEKDIHKLESRGLKEIHMCDAGCGSVPILAIYACLCSEKVKCTCLELNQDAIPVAQAIIQSFGLSSRIEVKQANAITYRSEIPFDLLVSETMHSGLTEEPMAQIFKNLSTQVVENGEIIPKRVSVRAGLMSIREFLGSGKVIKIYSDAHLHHYFDKKLPVIFSLDTQNPDDAIAFELYAHEGDTYLAVLMSDVEVGDGIHLGKFESLITMPQAIQSSDGNPEILTLKKGARLKVYYQAGSRQRDIHIKEI